MPGRPCKGSMTAPPERCLARGGAFKAQRFMREAELPAERGNGLSLAAGFRAQAMIDGEGKERSPLTGCPAMGEDQKRQGIPAAGDGDANGRVQQAGRQRGERCLKRRLWR